MTDVTQCLTTDFCLFDLGEFASGLVHSKNCLKKIHRSQDQLLHFLKIVPFFGFEVDFRSDFKLVGARCHSLHFAKN